MRFIAAFVSLIGLSDTLGHVHAHRVSSKGASLSIKGSQIPNKANPDVKQSLVPSSTGESSFISRDLSPSPWRKPSTGFPFPKNLANQIFSELPKHMQEKLEEVKDGVQKIDWTNIPDDIKAYIQSTNAAPAIKDATADVLAKLPKEFREKFEQVKEDVLQIDWENLPKELKSWIQQHPYQTAFYIVNGVVFFAPGLFTAPVLTAMGWTGAGPKVGSAAAALQSLLGPIRAKSLFATLQSAQMGGYGRAAVHMGTRVGASLVGVAKEIWTGLGRKQEKDVAKTGGAASEKGVKARAKL